MQIKKHLSGGSLRTAMAEEIIRVLSQYSGEDQSIEKAALHLGITPRTLRVWKGPIEKGGWTELQGTGGVEKVLAVAKSKPKKKAAKKSSKKKTSQAAEVRA